MRVEGSSHKGVFRNNGLIKPIMGWASFSVEQRRTHACVVFLKLSILTSPNKSPGGDGGIIICISQCDVHVLCVFVGSVSCFTSLGVQKRARLGKMPSPSARPSKARWSL